MDYTKEDFTRTGERYDLILDCVGHGSLSACRRVLTRRGRYVIVGAPHSRWLIRLLAGPIKALVLSRFVSQKFVTFIAKANKADLTIVRDLMASEKVTPVIDRRYRLSEVPEAIRYLEKGHARGKVVVTVEHT